MTFEDEFQPYLDEKMKNPKFRRLYRWYQFKSAVSDWWRPELNVQEARDAYLIRTVFVDVFLFVSGLAMALLNSEAWWAWTWISGAFVLWLVLNVRFFAWLARGKP